MENTSKVAMELGYLKVPDGFLIDIDEINNYTPDKITIITTGSQGEPMAALARIAYSSHRKISLLPNDLFILSSSPIPGNEKLISRIINQLLKKGAEVIYKDLEDVHVSGHACEEELKLIHNLVHPKFFLPVHGEFRHLKHHAELAEELGMKKENTFIIEIGDVLAIKDNKASVTEKVKNGSVFVDGLGIGDVGSVVIRDRKNLAQDGMINIVVTLHKESYSIIAGPDINTRGFVYVKDSEELINEIKSIAINELNRCLENNIIEWYVLKNNVKRAVARFVFGKTKRRPIVFLMIMEEIMYKSLLACEKVGSIDEINVVIQISKLGNYKTNDNDNWSGVRRYYIKNNHSILIEDLGKSNMADPNVLYDFIEWGCENYKADHTMLVLSDHGGGFIGCFTDLSLNVPYIMGIPEMIEAINAVRINLDYVIDILVLDMCCMNCIEIIYELGHEENAAVKTAVTYMDYAPYEGFGYDKLISATQTYNNTSDLNVFVKYLIDSQDFNMAAYDINHKKLEQIKLLFNDIAKAAENPLDALNAVNLTAADLDFVKNINDKLKSIVIYSKEPFKGINNSINITSTDVGYSILFYSKLAFSKDNLWKELLYKIPEQELSIQKDKIYVSLSSSSKPKIHYMLKFNKS